MGMGTATRAGIGLSFVGCLAACAPHPPAIVRPPSPLPVVTPDPPAPTPATRPIPESSGSTPTPIERPILQEALGPVEGVTLTTIKLPAVSSLVDVDGRDADDVFVLSSSAEVLEIVGGKARSLGAPSCPQPRPYAIAGETYEPGFYSVQPAKTGVGLVGYVTRYGRGSWTEAYDAASLPGGRWACGVSGPSPLVPRWSWGLPGYPSISFDGRPVPKTFEWNSGDSIELTWTGGAAHAWVSFSRAGLVEFDGTAWWRRPSPPFRYLDAIADDDAGTTWALGDMEDKSIAIARWNGETWSLLPVPTDFSASQILVAGAVTWFFGQATWYAWDGRSLRRLSAPIEAGDVWLSPTGDVWVAGRELVSGPITDDTPRVGALVQISRAKMAGVSP